MTRPKAMVLPAAAIGALLLSACSSGGSAASAPSPSGTAASSRTCPTGSTGAPTGGKKGGTIPSLVTSSTVAKSDTSTSVVLNVSNDPQFTCTTAPLTTKSNVVYSTPTLSTGKTLQLKFDIQVPKTSGKKPLLVYLSGGGFSISTPTAALDQRTYMADHGYVVASVQYRTIPNGATYTDSVADVKAAIRYLRAHAAEYNIDSSEVAVWGESAGGYLAAMVGTTNGIKKFDVGDNLDQSSAVQAVLDKFGPSDLALVAADFDAKSKASYASPKSNTATFVYGPKNTRSLTAGSAADKAANPATYVDASDPPFLLLHGSDDRLVSPSQTLLLHNALRAAKVQSTRYVIEGAGHGDLTVGTGASAATALWTTTTVMDKTVEFFNKQLKA